MLVFGWPWYKVFRKWLVGIIDINPLRATPPPVFMSIIRTSHFLNITCNPVTLIYSSLFSSYFNVER